MKPVASQDETRARSRPRYRYVRRRWHVLFAAIDIIGGAMLTVAEAIGGAWLRIVGRERTANQFRRSVVLSFDDAVHGVSPTQPTTNESTSEPIRKILVVQLDHLGDAVLSSGFFESLRRRHPAARIDVLCGPWNRELFENLIDVDGVHTLSRNRFSRNDRRFGWWAALVCKAVALRNEKYDLGIDVRGECPHALLLWLAGARHRLGWSAGGGGFLLTASADYVPDRHEVESRRALLALVDDLGHNAMPPQSRSDDVRDRAAHTATASRSDATTVEPRRLPNDELTPRLAASQASVDRVAESIDDAFRGPNAPRGPLVVVHVGAGTEAKQWPAQYWRVLVGRLAAEHDARVVLVGTKAEGRHARLIVGMRHWQRVVDWSGRLRLVELVALLQAADVFLGADSGPAHIAASVGCRTIVLFSGTNRVGQWKPAGRDVTVLSDHAPCSPCHCEVCPRVDHRCMTRILPETVLDAAIVKLRAAPNVLPLFAQDAPHNGPQDDRTVSTRRIAG